MDWNEQARTALLLTQIDIVYITNRTMCVEIINMDKRRVS